MNIDELYPHNREAYEKVEESFLTHDRAAIVHATGTGKSYVIAAVAADYRHVLILAPNDYVLDSNESDFTAAMQTETSDHEDAMQASVAARHGCDVIVTRDRRGFLKSSVPFMTPEDFLSKVPVKD